MTTAKEVGVEEETEVHTSDAVLCGRIAHLLIANHISLDF